jgi:hypothetical protein
MRDAESQWGAYTVSIAIQLGGAGGCDWLAACEAKDTHVEMVASSLKRVSDSMCPTGFTQCVACFAGLEACLGAGVVRQCPTWLLRQG